MHSLFRKFHDTVAAVRRARKARRTTLPPDAGLTLVEMIVVLAIIALVAALIVPNVIGRPDQARVTTTKANMLNLSGALKMYRLDNGSYPTTAQGLKALLKKPAEPPIPSSYPEEGYMSGVETNGTGDPIDPFGNPYIYESPAPGGFSLKSLGKDGKPGGEGLDADLTGGR